MLFNSLEFIYLFLPLTLGLFYLASNFRLLRISKYILITTSLLFYAYWKISYFLIIIASILLNYTLSLVMERYRKKEVLWAGIIFNLALLGYFKYSYFFLTQVLGLISQTASLAALAIPLGISFYTFTQITYLMDVYQKKVRPSSLGEYTLFVCFFPHLIAGPIVHYRALIPQFKQTRSYLLQYRNIFMGCFFFSAGLFQKVVMADSMSPVAETGFLNAPLLSFVEAWSALFAYSLQLYFDFAGYSNMAIGLGLLFNIRLPANFNSPYQAPSIIEFWKRWHMTLTQFLTDYVYMPLMLKDWLRLPLHGNLKGLVRAYVNIFLTMVIAGFWHGAGWTFILWGAYHGLLLVINDWIKRKRLPIPKLFSIGFTFLIVTYGWVFFKSASFDQAVIMTKSLLGMHGFQVTNTPFLRKTEFILIVILLFVALATPNVQTWIKKIKPNLIWGMIFAIMFTANLLFLNRESVFLYFQF